MEKWKKIEGFDGYFVSNKGRIKGIKVLKPLEQIVDILEFVCIKTEKNVID